jgi:hypothetical protein
MRPASVVPRLRRGLQEGLGQSLGRDRSGSTALSEEVTIFNGAGACERKQRTNELTSGELAEEMLYLHQAVAGSSGSQGECSEGGLSCHRGIHLARDWSLPLLRRTGLRESDKEQRRRATIGEPLGISSLRPRGRADDLRACPRNPRPSSSVTHSQGSPPRKKRVPW